MKKEYASNIEDMKYIVNETLETLAECTNTNQRSVVDTVDEEGFVTSPSGNLLAKWEQKFVIDSHENTYKTIDITKEDMLNIGMHNPKMRYSIRKYDKNLTKDTGETIFLYDNLNGNQLGAIGEGGVSIYRILSKREEKILRNINNLFNENKSMYLHIILSYLEELREYSKKYLSKFLYNVDVVFEFFKEGTDFNVNRSILVELSFQFKADGDIMVSISGDIDTNCDGQSEVTIDFSDYFNTGTIEYSTIGRERI